MSSRTKSASKPNGKPTATDAPQAKSDQPAYRLIDLALIDEPENPERETMEEGDLADLALSIQEIGLINPLTVKPKSGRYEVTAGHRRLLACRLVKYTPVPCTVREDGQVDHLAILVHENAWREDVNPVEEARFYDRLLTEHCGNDVDLLCLKVRRKRAYVEDRLLMLRYDQRIVAAIHQKKISMAVGRELAKVADPGRLLILLDVSIKQGATARQVAEWRAHGEQLGPVGEAPDTTAGAENVPQNVPLTPHMQCFFCQDSQFPHLLEYLYLHKPCKSILERMLQRQPASSPAPEGE